MRYAFGLLFAALMTTCVASDRPHVLLILVDDLRAELACYGHQHIHSPNIDALATSGRRFARAYCQQAVCNPSRTSLMTGLRPDTIGVTGNHRHFRSLRPNVVTLSQHFMGNGYHTRSIGKIYHGVFPDGASKTKWDTMGDPQSWSQPTTRFGPRYYYTEQGVTEAKLAFQSMYGVTTDGPDAWTKKLVFGPMTEAPDVSDDRLYDGRVAEAAVAAIAGWKESDQPQFLAVGFIKPHSPFVAPKKYWDLYDPEDMTLASQSELPSDAPAIAGHGSGEIRRYTDQPARGKISEQNARRMKHGYFACISFVDAQVGKVLAALEVSGHADNTIVVLASDHGYHLGEHGLWGKTTNFELDTQVPLIIRTPSMPQAGVSTTSIAELVDLYPTLSQLAGLPSPNDVDGTSLAGPVLDPNANSDGVAISQYPRGKQMGYSLRTDRWRLTEWIDSKTGQAAATELYDETNDGPIETRNLANAEEHQATRKRLTARLKAELGRVSGTSFEECEAGPFVTLHSRVGVWNAKTDHAEIDPNHHRSGQKCLHLLGGSHRSVELALDPMAPVDQLTFHAERWTKREPFRFRVDAEDENGVWREIYCGDQAVPIGHFRAEVEIDLQRNPRRLRFRCNSPSRSGLLIDDLSFTKAELPADLSLARVFGNSMVLQSDAELPIWGTARPGSNVRVDLNAASIETTADDRGNWSVRLPAQPVSSTPTELMVESADDQLVVGDVLFGEVWICAGQSNMEWTLAKSANGKQELESADHPQLRLLHWKGGARGSSGSYQAKHLARLVPETYCEGEWKVASAESAREFSAVAWYFGRDLQAKRDVPVGLICPAVGGTPAEAWIDRSALAADPKLNGMVAGNWLENDDLSEFCRDRARADLGRAAKAGEVIPSDDLGPNHSFKPGFMWDAAIQPLVPLAISGAIWYQGESNAESAKRVHQHGDVFPLLIQSWRAAWAQEFPFLFVQLPALNRPDWPSFRDHQRRIAEKLPNVKMAITIDTGHPSNVHPIEKKQIGTRLARLAMGKDSGPLFRSMSVTNSTVAVQFDHVGEGLRVVSKSPLLHFEIAGEDGEFHPATAHLKGKDSVTIQSSDVGAPKHVRYAWSPFPEPAVTLFNSDGLPASPFTTQPSELPQAVKPKADRPNILLIVGEDHGCELSCYGDPVIKTPHLDGLARDGMLFRNGYVTQSVCSPSRSTLFTGLYPHQNGQLGLATHQFGWFQKWPTTYSLLKEAGYRTGLIGKTHVIPEAAVEDFVDFRHQPKSNFAKKAVADYAKRAGEFMKASEEPFFMTVNYPDAHWPLQGTVDGLPETQVDAADVQVMPYVGGSNPRMKKIAKNYYDCMLRLDACVGQLLRELDDSGKADDTLVVFVGDHGAQMARGKVTVYEGGLKVPFLARWPGVIQPLQQSSALVSTIDLLPTFSDVGKAKTPAGLPGKSLRAAWNDPEAAFRETLVCERNCDASHLTFPQRTIRDQRFKLIHSPVRDREDPAARYYRIHGATHWSGCLTDAELADASERTQAGYARWMNPPELQLYDLQSDPSEWTDLANDPKHADVRERLLGQLKDWQRETRDVLRDPQRLQMLMDETDSVNEAKRRSPKDGWQYLSYLNADRYSELAFESTQSLFVSGTEDTHTFRIPAIATATNGDLIAACDARRKASSDLVHQRTIDIVFRRSQDNGQTWSPMEVMDPIDNGGSSDPSLIVDQTTGDVFCFYNSMNNDKSSKEYRFIVQKSGDHGKTWGPPI
ncbi:MAG: sulfatase-like hydrolase/transferase, partial [Rubripirellula sp.]